ncbi:MAG: glycosyltransferase [Planctomycetota bacterium]
MSTRYCLIVPCRDEELYAERTLDSLVRQTFRPSLVVVVDDGSTDSTPKILKRYSSKHPWIKVLTRTDRGSRKVGPGVIDAFYEGYQTIDSGDFTYVCKLDFDLDLPPRYFEILIHRMDTNPRIGTCSGKPYFPGPTNATKTFAGELISEGCGDEMSVGMAKLYRTECFEEIGGFVREVMWDGIDCHQCRMKGWIAESYDDEMLRFIHLRPMGSSHRGILTGRLRHGFGQYYMGTGLAYMLASSIFRMSHRPRVIGGAAMACGYLSSMARRRPRYVDTEFRRFLRKFQWRCLLHGKQTATAALNQQMKSTWLQRSSKQLRIDSQGQV